MFLRMPIILLDSFALNALLSFAQHYISRDTLFS